MKQPTQAEWSDFHLAEANWSTMQDQMAKFRRAFFPLGTLVMVNCVKFQGFGTVAAGACAPNQLPVLLDNGNVWFYDISDCEPAPEAEP